MTGAVGAPLPPTDAAGTTALNATAGKVALVSGATALACNGDSTPCDAAQAAQIVDLVGYGTASFSEGAPAPAPSASTADLRAGGGCVDTDVNSADFAAGAPAPRSSGTAPAPCGGPPPGDAAPTVVSTTPPAGATGVATGTSPSVVFSEPVAVDPGAFAIACASSGAHPLAASGGPTTFSLDPAADFSPGESCTLTVAAASVHDLDGDDPPDTMAADVAVLVQGLAAGHARRRSTRSRERRTSRRSSGRTSSTTGIVTAVRPNGFYLQDPSPDADPATSEAIFVFARSAAAAVVGRRRRPGQRRACSEFRADTVDGLTTTELGIAAHDLRPLDRQPAARRRRSSAPVAASRRAR